MTDNDPFVFCPYNKCHQVKRSRLQIHLIKCEKRYPKMDICPYNATHRVPVGTLKYHISECPVALEWNLKEKPSKYATIITTPKPIGNGDFMSKYDPNLEFWDD